MSRVGGYLILSVPVDPALSALFPARIRRMRRVLTLAARSGVPAELVETEARFALALPLTEMALATRILDRIDAIMMETYAEGAVARRLGLSIAALRDHARGRVVTPQICHADRQGRRYAYAAYCVTDILVLARGMA